MFRAFQQPLLARVPYATLFAYNPVLQSVFEAPSDKVALTVELPGQPVRDYTYGRLQRDVVALSNAVVQRREVVAKARGATAPLSWVQPHKPATVRSVFAQGDGTPSCDVLQDSGVYNGALMCGPGYGSVVSLLTLWATNHMAVPVSVEADLSHALGDSRARLLFSCSTEPGEGASTPEDHTLSSSRLAVRTLAQAARLSPQTEEALRHDPKAVGDRADCLEAIFDMRALLHERASAHERHLGDDASMPLDVEWLMPAEDAFSTVLESADDVVARLEKERAAAEERKHARQLELLRLQHKEKHRVPVSLPPLCFDTDALHELNALHRRWLESPASRPRENEDCLLLYRGDNGASPGAVHTHGSVGASIKGLAAAWRVTESDALFVHVTRSAERWSELLPTLAVLTAHGSSLVPHAGLEEPSVLSQRLTRGDVTGIVGDAGLYAQLSATVGRGMSRIEQTGFRNTIIDQVRFCGCLGRLDDMVHRDWHATSRHFVVTCLATVEAGAGLVQPLRGAATPPGMTLPACDSEASAVAIVPSTAPSEGGERPGQLLLASPTLMDRYWRQPSSTHRRMVEDVSTRTRYCATGVTIAAAPEPVTAPSHRTPTPGGCYRFA